MDILQSTRVTSATDRQYTFLLQACNHWRIAGHYTDNVAGLKVDSPFSNGYKYQQHQLQCIHNSCRHGAESYKKLVCMAEGWKIKYLLDVDSQLVALGQSLGMTPRLVAINCSLFLPCILLQVASTSYVQLLTCSTDGSNQRQKCGARIRALHGRLQCAG